jgi:hypothetical protein
MGREIVFEFLKITIFLVCYTYEESYHFFNQGFRVSAFIGFRVLKVFKFLRTKVLNLRYLRIKVLRILFEFIEFFLSS